MRETTILLRDGSEENISLAKTINIIATNEMKPLVDDAEFTASYSWEWLAEKVLELHHLTKEDIVHFGEFLLKVKSAYHLVKNPSYIGFNPVIDTYRHKELGSRLLKLSRDSPSEVRQMVSNQKLKREMSRVKTHNERMTSRALQIGFSGKKIEFKEE